MTANTESILGSVKKLLGVEDYFDSDLIIGINTTFAKLQQIGVGPTDGFSISDGTTTWSEYTNDENVLNMVKSYMAIQVKLLFDISTASSYLIQELNKKSDELEWRLNAAVDFKKEES